MKSEFPDDVKVLLDDVTTSLQSLIKDNMVGIYLHGSLAMGSFNPLSSDVDFIVVTKHKLGIEKRKEIADAMLALNEQAPPKGLEMSVITLAALLDMQHPMPFEFHFSNDWVDKFKRGEVDSSQERKDSDLAAHLTIIKARGVTLYGLPIDELFPVVPKHYYLDSIESDANDILTDMTSNPVYNVLNLCRVWAYKEDELITSKREGGEWAAARADDSMKHVLAKALSEYAGQKQAIWDEGELRQFGSKMATILNLKSQ